MAKVLVGARWKWRLGRWCLAGLVLGRVSGWWLSGWEGWWLGGSAFCKLRLLLHIIAAKLRQHAITGSARFIQHIQGKGTVVAAPAGCACWLLRVRGAHCTRASFACWLSRVFEWSGGLVFGWEHFLKTLVALEIRSIKTCAGKQSWA
eukprot:351992-Chlamydomonas_euryale.AAC.7